jgi:hypothetical protein
MKKKNIHQKNKKDNPAEHTNPIKHINPAKRTNPTRHTRPNRNQAAKTPRRQTLIPNVAECAKRLNKTEKLNDDQAFKRFTLPRAPQIAHGPLFSKK